MNKYLEIRQIDPSLEAMLANYFITLAKAGEDEFFKPHPFTVQEARKISHYDGEDYYALALYRDEPIAYGLLRGWDEGYKIPSLGISIRPDFRGKGLANLFMLFLHSVALLRGCEKIRLRVNRNNIRARNLYSKMGYVFVEEDENFLLGYLTLSQT